MEKGEIEEIKRYFGVVAEGLRTDIQQVAEDHEVIRNEIQALREENEQAHREILSASNFHTPNWIKESESWRGMFKA
jgi:hypothetical protein